jgi:hypothetical protein
MSRGHQTEAAVRAFTPNGMREVLGSFCSGVTVVTAMGDEPGDTTNSHREMG